MSENHKENGEKTLFVGTNTDNGRVIIKPSVRDELGRFMNGDKSSLKRFRSETDLRERVIDYLEQCERDEKLPTVSGLALALGFRSRMSLLRYEKEEGYEKYFDLIAFAKLKIMEAREDALTNGRGNVIGLIFALKNAGEESWTDKNESKVVTQDATIKGFQLIEDDGKRDSTN